MIDILEARLSADNRCIIVEAKIEDINYYEGVTIDSILIDNLDTLNDITGQAKVAYNELNTLYDIVLDEDKRHVKVIVSIKDLFGKDAIKQNNIFFVQVMADVANAPNLMLSPCNCDVNKRVVPVFNRYELYKTLLGSIKDIQNDCTDNTKFADDIFKLMAVKTNLNTGNYVLAAKYYKEFFADRTRVIHRKSCGCNGYK